MSVIDLYSLKWQLYKKLQSIRLEIDFRISGKVERHKNHLSAMRELCKVSKELKQISYVACSKVDTKLLHWIVGLRAVTYIQVYII